MPRSRIPTGQAKSAAVPETPPATATPGRQIKSRAKDFSFSRTVLASGLVAHDELERVKQELENLPAGDEQDLEKRLANQFVQMKVLTQYQANQLLAGQTKFSLGPYIITDWLGQGGMGQVFKAIHNVMGRESAVKVLPLDKSTPYAIANFIREIRTQAQLDHPHLVRAYDAG
ncbi:MAG: hypothetical protein VB817_06015, partial [Pirellulaceae bacterium]